MKRSPAEFSQIRSFIFFYGGIMKAYTFRRSKNKAVCENSFLVEAPPLSSTHLNGFAFNENEINSETAIFFQNNGKITITELGIKKIIVKEPMFKYRTFPCGLYQPYRTTTKFVICPLKEIHQASGIIVRLFFKRDIYYEDFQNKLNRIYRLFSTLSAYENPLDENEVCIAGISEMKITEFRNTIAEII